MAQIINKTKGFGSIPRDLVYDYELSDRARFLYVYMACKPEGWEFIQDVMAKELGYSKDTLRKYLNELITRGWIVEEGQQNINGKFGAKVYTIEVKIEKKNDEPCRKNTDTVNYRNGKTTTQRNIYNKEINKEEEINNINNKKESEQDLFKEDSPEYKFDKWFKENFPQLAKNDRPLKYKTFINLQSKYTKEQILLKLNAMEAKKNFNKDYCDVGRTLYNWLARDFKPTK